MRVFVALLPNKSSLKRISHFLLDSTGAHSELDIHLTLCFLGSLPQHQMDQVIQSLEGLPKSMAVKVTFSHLNWFPNVQKPLVWALEGEMNEGIKNILLSLQPSSLFMPNYPLSEFRPHLSLLARKYSKEVSLNLEPLELGCKGIEVSFDRLVLLGSEGRQGKANIGPSYTIIWQRPLL